MIRRYQVPPFMADIVTGAGIPGVPMKVRYRLDGDRFTAIERRPDRSPPEAGMSRSPDIVWMFSDSGEGPNRFRFHEATAASIEPTLPGEWGCTVHEVLYEGPGCEAGVAEFLLSAGACLVQFTLDPTQAAADFAPPAWTKGLPPADGARGFELMREPGWVSVDMRSAGSLSALCTPDRQRELAFRLLAQDWDVPSRSKWDEVRNRAADVGMALSRDKALVRSGLAPLVAGCDLAAFLAGIPECDARIVRECGLCVLRLDDGSSLGPVANTEGHPTGTLVLGPDVPFPTALPVDVALALAAEGRHDLGEGRAAVLTAQAREGSPRAQLCGIAPAALGPGPRR